MKKRVFLLPLVFVLLYVVTLFRPLFFENRLPIPADTIVGLYHPWRDFFSGEYPSGIPYHNFLITDPVRQQYLWRQLAIENLKSNSLPLWNPDNFAGTPLLANFQTAAFYPPNILYWLIDFADAWSLQIVLQIVFGGLFLYFYLANLKLRWEGVTLGTLAWLGSGFFVSWLEWNTVIQSALWLPLLLLAVDKIFFFEKKRLWAPIFILSLVASFFAGHLQTFFYLFVAVNIYVLFRAWQTRRYLALLVFFVSYVLFFILVSPQLLPTLVFIQESARSLDQANWNRPEWFLPWQNLVQLVAPDFFGHPATLNYFGIFSYQEFVSYIGIVPLLFALFTLFSFKDSRVRFFALLAGGALLFALPTPLARLPFVWHLPLVSSVQPTRLLFLANFSLAALAAIGLDHFLKKTKDNNRILLIAVVLLLILVSLFTFARSAGQMVSVRNLYLPLGLAGASGLLVFLYQKLPWFQGWLIAGLLLLTLFDVSRFAIKFESFSSRGYLFPKTKALDFLQEKAKGEVFRIATAHDMILPPNFSLAYRLQTVAGYDPLYLRRYGQLVAAIESESPDLAPALGFNRIITPKNYSSKFFDLLNVKYLLSLSAISSPRYKLVFQEGQTRIYENTSVLPRAFFVSEVVGVASVKEGLEQMFSDDFVLDRQAVVENLNWGTIYLPESPGKVIMRDYQDNRLTLETSSTSDGFLVLTDSFYPGWQATIDGRAVEIFPTDVAFRGVIVPAGNHTVVFRYPPSL